MSGAVFVGLLAARNAGIEVPDEAINRAISFYAQMSSASGEVAYAGGMGGFGESLARSSIATLVFSVARRKDLEAVSRPLDYLKQASTKPRSKRGRSTLAITRPRHSFKVMWRHGRNGTSCWSGN